MMTADFLHSFIVGGRSRLTGKRNAAIFLFLAAVGITSVLSGRAGAENRGPWTLPAVLRQLDVTAKDFQSLSADIERTKVTVVVNDHSTETGSIFVRGDKMLLEMKAPDARTILRTGDNVYIYTPGLKRVEEYNVGKNRAVLEKFLLLGFGTQGKELQKAYLVTVVGEPALGDVKTVELELTPKSDEVRNQFSKIQIWFDQSSWLPVQQQFNETGSGDYFTIHYTKIVRNPGLSDARFKPHWPKGTEQIKH
jgi:outer membrane lipoprotein-sorting protein